MSSSTYDQVLVQLSPYVGIQMARAILNAHCQTMGLLPAELATGDLGPLAQRLQTALKAFLGGARAAVLVASIGQLE